MNRKQIERMKIPYERAVERFGSLSKAAAFFGKPRSTFSKHCAILGISSGNGRGKYYRAPFDTSVNYTGIYRAVIPLPLFDLGQWIKRAKEGSRIILADISRSDFKKRYPEYLEYLKEQPVSVRGNQRTTLYRN